MAPNGTAAKNPTESALDHKETVDVDGGTLVYDPIPGGRELLGFTAVEDWDALADALAARGHDRGAIHHKPVF